MVPIIVLYEMQRRHCSTHKIASESEPRGYKVIERPLHSVTVILERIDFEVNLPSLVSASLLFGLLVPEILASDLQ